MREEALKLADDMEDTGKLNVVGADMIRKLVSDLNKALKQNERLLDTVFNLREELDCANDYIKQYQLEKKQIHLSNDGFLIDDIKRKGGL